MAETRTPRRADAPVTTLTKAVDPEKLAVAQESARQQMDVGGIFSPGMPLTPFDGVSGLPRAWNFPTGYNLKSRADRDGRLSFALLKTLTDTYDVANMCINHRIDDVRSLNWTVRSADWVETDDKASVARARKALKKPDGVNPFRSWLAMFLRDVLRYDAGCLYRRRNMLGDVIALDVVSGMTIAPLQDDEGRRPHAPAPAFVQYISGTPWEWLTEDDLIYMPFRPESESPYGMAPLEAVLLSANTDMRFQQHWMNWFTEGNIPEGFATAPAEITTPEQLEKWEAYWEAMNTDDRVKHKLKMIPHGTVLEFPKEKEFDPEFPMFLMRKVCAAFHVTPNDLGFTEDVNRATGDTQVDVQFRIGTLPLIRHVEDILTDYLQDDLGLPVVFEFDTGQEKEDRLATAQAQEIHIRNGVVSPDEIREREYGLPTDASRPVPRFIYTNTQGPIPLRSLLDVAGPVDPQTAAPSQLTPLDTTPFDGTPGVLPHKSPGSPQFARAPIDPDEPSRPALEQEVPGSGIVAPPAPAVKSLEPVVSVAGLALCAQDTGRVLLIQRAVVEADPAAGRWEFPGGHMEDGETPAEAAKREWMEETGLVLPADARVVQYWDNGIYRLHIATIPSEAELPINPSEGRITNPDDPGGDAIEACAWWEVNDLPGMAALREEAQATPWAVLSAVTVGDIAALRKELAKWKQNTLTRLNRGQRPRRFESDVIPQAVIEKVWTQLDGLTDHGSVEGAFNLSGDDAGPKVGTPDWRSDPPVKAPQHAVDLRLTDYWAPRIARALRATWTRTQFVEAIARASFTVNTVRKDNAPPPPPFDSVLAGSANTEALGDALRSMHLDAFNVGLQAAQVQLGITPEGWDTWRPGMPANLAPQPGAWQTAMDDAAVTVKDITDTTMDRIGRAIERGVTAGDSVDMIARDLFDVLSDPDRAELIAHTESARMLTNASMVTYREMGVKQWDLLVSAGACPTCLDVAADNPHNVGDRNQPPIHPRCRCAAAPSIENL